MSDYDFIDVDQNTILKEIIEDMENEVGEALYPGDERRIFANAMAFVLASTMATINDACKQKLLRYARGEVLDDIVAGKDITRQESIKATVMVRFIEDEPRSMNVTIPKGTQVTGDYEHYFETAETDIIYANTTSVDILCEAVEGGEDYNDAQIGTIDKLADDIDVDRVENITISEGGEDEEDDESLKNRYRNAPANSSVAGPADCYKEIAMNANINISDAYVTSYAPAEVTIYPILYGGEIPSDEILQQVLDACNEYTVRPIGDRVFVEAPSQVEFDIELKYYYEKGNDEVVDNIEGTDGAIVQYLAWQTSTLGRAINPDYLRKLCFVPGDDKLGADRVEIVSPEYQTIEPYEVAHFSGNLTVTSEETDS